MITTEEQKKVKMVTTPLKWVSIFLHEIRNKDTLTLSVPIEIIVSLYHQPTQLFFQLNDISRKQKT